MIKKIKFDYFANGRYAGTMEIPASAFFVARETEQIFIDHILSKRPSLKRDKITICVYKS